MEAQAAEVATSAAGGYPKPPRTCEIVSGEDGVPGTLVRCAHCGEAFKTTAWNWKRRSFIARRCQDAIRAAKAVAGVQVTRARKEPAAVTLGRAAVTATQPPPPHDGPDLMWASPECGRERPRVFRSDMTETFAEGVDGGAVLDALCASADEALRAGDKRFFDFAGGDPAREGREIVTCPACGKPGEQGATPWAHVLPDSGTVYLHVGYEVAGQGRRQNELRRKMQTWCIVWENGTSTSFVNGRAQ
jgi:uncharacterized C2H2 Zn-finger protein